MILMQCHTTSPSEVLGKTLQHDFTKLPSLKLTANAPENGPSEKETTFPTIHFQVLLLLVSRRVIIIFVCFFLYGHPFDDHSLTFAIALRPQSVAIGPTKSHCKWLYQPGNVGQQGMLHSGHVVSCGQSFKSMDDHLRKRVTSGT